jgi:8-oxo-dGTP pyrophosphatase MutT (NUDIX family)
MASSTAFDTIESAQEFLALLREAVEEAKLTANSDITQTEGRNIDALRIVLYKLEKLEQHLKVSGRLLNDLRTLRRLLLEERVNLPAENQELTSRVA